jgi:NhaP-type Na+/H+ or K+/H+ antiporter
VIPTLSSVHKLLSRFIPHDPNVGFALLVVGLGCLALWLGALQSCIGNETPTETRRRNWILLIIFFGPIGALAYFLIRRPQRVRELGW